MRDNLATSEGRPNRWPLALDDRDPEGIASFGLYLGYAQDDVVNTLVQRCSLDPITARRIVTDVTAQSPGGNA